MPVIRRSSTQTIPQIMTPPISILILTKNEARDLPECLAPVFWSDDIHVFDSYSTDFTVAIAQQGQAHVHQRVFDDYATHRNAALAAVPSNTPGSFSSTPTSA